METVYYGHYDLLLDLSVWESWGIIDQKIAYDGVCCYFKTGERHLFSVRIVNQCTFSSDSCLSVCDSCLYTMNLLLFIPSNMDE